MTESLDGSKYFMDVQLYKGKWWHCVCSCVIVLLKFQPSWLITTESSEEPFGIDANKFGNEMRFINDYRNIADEQNSEFSPDWVHGEYRMRIVATRCIEADEEILTDYGEEYWRARLLNPVNWMFTGF